MEIKIFNKLPDSAKMIRDEVFVKEQGFIDEYDEKDDIASHIVLFDGNEPIATLRLYETDEPGVFMFGRIAVVKSQRKGGVGRKIMSAAEEYVHSKGGKKVILHAQLQAKGFYEKAGYKVFGELEYEQDCPHVWMEKKIV